LQGIEKHSAGKWNFVKLAFDSLKDAWVTVPKIQSAETRKEIQVAIALLIVDPNSLSEKLNAVHARKLHEPSQAGVNVFCVKFGNPFALAQGSHLQKRESRKKSLPQQRQ
jgi:hypothetical protein